MSASIAPRHATAQHLDRVLAWLDLMGEFGLACFERLVASSRAPAPIASAHAPYRDPITAAERFSRGIIWAGCLSLMLCGTYCLLPARPRRAPTEAAPPAQNPSQHPSPTQATAPRCDDPVMHAAFRTRPVGKIVETICRDLGIGRNHALWPADLVAITQTAADWTAVILATTRRPIPTQAAPPPPAANPAPNPPAPDAPAKDPRAAPTQRAP